MRLSDCIGIEYIDNNRKRHIAEEVCFADSVGGTLRSKDGKLIRIITDPSLAKQCSKTIERIISKPRHYLPADSFALPEALLVNAGTNVLGYCYSNKKNTTLRSYISCPPSERLYRWYFTLTGGLSYRLKLGYLIGRRLSELHAEQVLLNNLSPDFIFTDSYELGSLRPEILISGLEFISSYSILPVFKGQPLYCDPTVSNGLRAVSTYSDAFSFAVLLFQLLTTWHPFFGDLSKQEVSIDAARFEKYIGDPCAADDYYEDVQLFIPNELRMIFEKMFVDGLNNIAMRPSLTEIIDACLVSLNHIARCDDAFCGKEYDGTLYSECPFCNNHRKGVKVISYKSIISDKKLLMPHGVLKQESALPKVNIEGSTFILTPGPNFIPKSFFDPKIGYKNDGKCISIDYDTTRNTVTINNRFKKLGIVANSKMIPSYRAGSKKSGITFYIGKDPITILLPFNTNLVDESNDEIKSSHYGDVKTQWILEIVQGD